MKTNLTHLFAALALLAPIALSGPAAKAADYGAVVVDGGETTPVEYGSGWYLRGDIGTFHVSGEGSYGVGGSATMGGVSLFEEIAPSVGFGYIFSDMLRGDITVTHYGGMTFDGQSAYYNCGLPYTGECGTDDSADVSATAIQANAYYSFGNWGTLTPYVGGGIGLARVNFDRTVLDTCRLDVGEDCPIATHSGGPGTEQWVGTTARQVTSRNTQMVLSAMVGADYRLTDRWKLDMGYKFTTFRDVGFNSDETAPNASGINIHEVKVGLRYEIW